MSYLTTCRSATQKWHSDTCSYLEPNTSGYCKEYYSLLIATQHVSLAMGGTLLSPGTHNIKTTSEESWAARKPRIQTVLNPGDGILYNWKCRHNAGANILYNARILLALSFESAGKGMPYFVSC